MKKFLLSLLLVFPLYGFAQKGMQGIGVNLGVGMTFEEEMAINTYLNYQRHLSDQVRLSCSLGLYGATYYDGDLYYHDEYGRESYGDYFYCLIAADLHYFFNEPRRLRPYAIGGVLFGVGEGNFLSDVVSGVKLGFGLTYRLGYHLAMNLEAPLYLMEGGSFLPTLGLAYTF